MVFLNSKSQRRWQKQYLNTVFENQNSEHQTFSKIILNNPELSIKKNAQFPKSLFKFYSPTSDNIIDVKKQRLWFAHPSSFNDPFDCNTGYDAEAYEKYNLLEHIKKVGYVNFENSKNGFTKDDYDRIYNSVTEYDYNWLSKKEEYWNSIREISENKSEEFEKEIYNLRRHFQNDVERKIEKLREINIRIACFSDLKTGGFPPNHTDFEYMIQMWSHYASNHEGFCVEYDITQLHPDNILPFEQKSYLDDYNELQFNRTKLILSAGLFPVIYTSSRVNIPKTKLKKIELDKDGNIKHNYDIDPLLYKTYIIKSSKWNYEKEWRIIVDGAICNHFDNKIHFPFIKRIYLGCKMKTHTVDILIEIAKELNVKIVLMAMNDKKFFLEPQSVDSYMWKKERNKWNNPFF